MGVNVDKFTKYLFSVDPFVEIYKQVLKGPEVDSFLHYGFFISYGVKRDVKINPVRTFEDEKSLGNFLGKMLHTQKQISNNPNLNYNFSEDYGNIFAVWRNFCLIGTDKEETSRIKRIFEDFNPTKTQENFN